MKMLFHTPLKTLATLAGASALVLPAAAASLRYTIAAGPDNGQLGASLASLGDLDADGISDFAVGDPAYTASGAAALDRCHTTFCSMPACRCDRTGSVSTSSASKLERWSR